MASLRRMGPKGSEIWHSMLDAAEVILSDLGHGALTSRLIAERIGVKQRLVYYYFSMMDELIVETFQRLATRDRERMTAALEGHHSQRDIWDVCMRTADTRMVQEFMALANRLQPLRIEVRAYIELSRAMHISAISRAIGDTDRQSALTRPPPRSSHQAPRSQLTILSGSLAAGMPDASIRLRPAIPKQHHASSVRHRVIRVVTRCTCRANNPLPSRIALC